MPEDYGDHNVINTRTRGPLLWALIPITLGYTLGRITQIGLPPWISVAGWLMFAGFLIAWSMQFHSMIRWKVYGTTGLCILSWTYFIYRHAPPPDWGTKPEREAEVQLAIQQPLNSADKYGRESGYAKIVKAPSYLQKLEGQNVYYLLRPAQGMEALIRSQIVAARGVIRPIQEDKGFDAYLLNQGITLRLEQGNINTSIHPANGFHTFCHKALQRMESILNQGSEAGGSSEANIYTAMLLGKKASLNKEQKDAFKRTGSLHLFAISGLHVGVIAGCLALILRLLKVPKTWGAILGLLTLLLYVETTGATASAMRAFLMVSFYWGARAFERKKEAFSALLASALVALVLKPIDLFNIGFQLSYAVVGAILLYGLPLNEQLNHLIQKQSLWSGLRKKITQGVAGLFGISLAANLGSAILSMLYFNILAPGAIPLGMVLVPLASVVITGGCLSLILGLIGVPWVSGLINVIAWKVISLMGIIIGFMLKIPGLFLEVGLNKPWIALSVLLALFYLLIIGHIQKKLNRPYFYITPLILITALITFSE